MVQSYITELCDMTDHATNVFYSVKKVEGSVGYDRMRGQRLDRIWIVTFHTTL